MMKPSFYNLIIVSPGDPRILKFHISRQAVVILVVAFLVSFLVTVAIGSSVVPEKLSTLEHRRLSAENQDLQVENMNAAIHNERLEAQLNDLEKRSSHVSALVE